MSANSLKSDRDGEVRQVAPRHYLEAALANVADAVITIDVADCITFMNASAEALIGVASAEVIGRPLAVVMSIVDVASGYAIGEAVEACVRKEGTRDQRRAVLLGAAERPIIIDYHVSVLRDAGDRLGGAVVVFRDIMLQRTAELALKTTEETLLANAEALFEEKERAQVTLNSIGDAVISIDFRGWVTFLNVIAEKMTGWTQAEACGQLLDKIYFLVDSTTREHVSCPTMQSIIEDRTVRVEGSCVLIRRDGEEIAVEISASPIHDKRGGVVGAVMVAHDVTVARDQAEKLTRLALHDTLTGLPNRTLLADRLDQALERTQRNGSMVSMLFIDLDRFKPVNDSLGHSVGDQLLQMVALRLRACVRSSDTVSRFGGDEFIIMLADTTHAEDAAICATKVTAALNAPFEIAGHRLQIGASIGIATSPTDAADSATLMRNADIAMYQAKAAGRNRYQFFRREMVSGAVV